MSKTYKVLSAVVVALMIVAISSNVFAAINMDNIKSNAATDADGAIETIGSTILSAITSVGMVLAIIVVAVLGIKYMMGSVEEKAEYKKTMIPYLVGAVLVFGASAIGKAVVNMGGSLI